MIEVAIYNQGNSQWRNKTMGPSGLTLGSFGCLVTCVAASLNNYAKVMDPGVLVDKLQFDVYGNLALPSVESAVPGVFFHDRQRTTLVTNEPSTQKMGIFDAMARIQKFLRVGIPVMLNVDLIGQDKNSDHWVLCYDTDWNIMDPAFGEKTSLLARYGTPEKSIYGYCVWLGSPIGFPDDGEPDKGQAVYKLACASRGINVQMNVKEALNVLL